MGQLNTKPLIQNLKLLKTLIFFSFSLSFYLEQHDFEQSAAHDFTGADLQHVVSCLLQDELHDFIQHTALITPYENTATKTNFKTISIESFQQLQFLQSIITPYYLSILLILNI